MADRIVDGVKVVGVPEGVSDDEIRAFLAKDKGDQDTGEPDTGNTEFVRTALQVPLFDFADELEAGITTGAGLLGDYRGEVEDIRRRLDRYAETNPAQALAATGVGLAGSMLIPGAGQLAGLKAAASAPKLARLASMAAKPQNAEKLGSYLGKAALAGAGSGAVSGVGQSRDISDVGDVATQAAKGAGMGAGFGAAFGAAGRALSSPTSIFKGRIGQNRGNEAEAIAAAAKALPKAEDKYQDFAQKRILQKLGGSPEEIADTLSGIKARLERGRGLGVNPALYQAGTPAVENPLNLLARISAGYTEEGQRRADKFLAKQKDELPTASGALETVLKDDELPGFGNYAVLEKDMGDVKTRFNTVVQNELRKMNLDPSDEEARAIFSLVPKNEQARLVKEIEHNMKVRDLESGGDEFAQYQQRLKAAGMDKKSMNAARKAAREAEERAAAEAVEKAAAEAEAAAAKAREEGLPVTDEISFPPIDEEADKMAKVRAAKKPRPLLVEGKKVRPVSMGYVLEKAKDWSEQGRSGFEKASSSGDKFGQSTTSADSASKLGKMAKDFLGEQSPNYRAVNQDFAAQVVRAKAYEEGRNALTGYGAKSRSFENLSHELADIKKGDVRKEVIADGMLRGVLDGIQSVIEGPGDDYVKLYNTLKSLRVDKNVSSVLGPDRMDKLRNAVDTLRQVKESRDVLSRSSKESIDALGDKDRSQLGKALAEAGIRLGFGNPFLALMPGGKYGIAKAAESGGGKRSLALQDILQAQGDEATKAMGSLENQLAMLKLKQRALQNVNPMLGVTGGLAAPDLYDQTPYD